MRLQLLLDLGHGFDDGLQGLVGVLLQRGLSVEVQEVLEERKEAADAAHRVGLHFLAQLSVGDQTKISASALRT